jgi:HEAT repeat protein
MWLFEAAGLFVFNAVWRITKLRSLGRIIAIALGSRNENVRTIAGIFLVRAGRAAEPLLEEALLKRENLPIVLTALGDIGDKRAEADIRRFSVHEDPAVAEAAQHALRILAMQR